MFLNFLVILVKLTIRIHLDFFLFIKTQDLFKFYCSCPIYMIFRLKFLRNFQIYLLQVLL